MTPSKVLQWILDIYSIKFTAKIQDPVFHAHTVIQWHLNILRGAGADYNISFTGLIHPSIVKMSSIYISLCYTII